MSDDESPREIPVSYPDSGAGPLVTTTGKVIGWLIVLLTAVISVEGYLLSNRFETIVDSRFDRFELRLSREYAQAKDTLPRPEYELRHAELVERDKQLTDRINSLEERVSKATDRILILERKR